MPSTERKNGLALRKPEGFALITAIMAIMILLALGYLALNVTTADLRISSRVVGEKKALSAAEAGIHLLMQNFDPESHEASEFKPVDDDDTRGDPTSVYKYGNASIPTFGPAVRPLVGYAVGGGQQWGQRCYMAGVEGKNTRYNSSVQIDVGMGYGPIEISTMSR